MASALLCFSGAIVSCGNNHVIQSEDRNITSVAVKEGTVPEEIFIGKFDKSGIKLIVSYSDETSEEVAVTESMVPENYRQYLSQPGVYTITILYKGETTNITVKMVFPHYVVNFYAYVTSADYTLVSSQDLNEGSSIEEPEIEEELYFDNFHYTFTGWDKEFYTADEPMNIYAQYCKVEYYEVTFYNGNNEIISAQKVDKNGDATEPTAEAAFVEGYTFLGWDRSYSNITKQTDVNGLYIAVQKTGNVDSQIIYQSETITDEFYNLSLLNDKSGYRIDSVKKMEADMVIPSYYHGLPIVTIADHLCTDNDVIETLTIGYNLKEITDYSFNNMRALKTVVIPNSVTSIGYIAFRECDLLQYTRFDNGYYLGNEDNPYLALHKPVASSISNINIHRSCKYVCSYALCELQNNYNVSFHDGIKVVSKGALQYSGVKTVRFPKNMEVISQDMFYCAGSLTSVTLPEKLKKIESHSFAHAVKLEEITFPETLETIEGEAFWNSKTIQTIELPGSMKLLATQVFFECDKLENVVINKGITKINARAFYKCPLLTHIEFTGTIDEWNSVNHPADWAAEIGTNQLICSDGVVEIEAF